MEIKTKLLFFVFPNILSGDFPRASEPQIRQATLKLKGRKTKAGKIFI